jgi:hypothetical protein
MQRETLTDKRTINKAGNGKAPSQGNSMILRPMRILKLWAKY